LKPVPYSNATLHPLGHSEDAHPQPDGFLGFAHSRGRRQSALPDAMFEYEMWSPSLLHPFPPTLPMIYVAWSIFHCLHVFGNRYYSILFVRDGDTIVHRSCILPGYFRWPFMAKDDLQVTAVWTHPEYRRRGIAKFAIATILHRFDNGKRLIWYISRPDNIASLGLTRATGLQSVGTMQRSKRFGSRVLGSFRIVKPGGMLVRDERPSGTRGWNPVLSLFKRLFSANRNS
jgi:ribosomal protein S18 acetylase RimI-like enzyme